MLATIIIRISNDFSKLLQDPWLKEHAPGGITNPDTLQTVPMDLIDCDQDAVGAQEHLPDSQRSPGGSYHWARDQEEQPKNEVDTMTSEVLSNNVLFHSHNCPG